jgi:hypothetical protein
LRWGPINEEDSDAETFACKDWLVHDNKVVLFAMGAITNGTFIAIGGIIIVGFMIGIFGIIIIVFIVIIARTTTAITNSTVIGRG